LQRLNDIESSPDSQLVICATPRCGSTFLGNELASANLIGNPEEWFQNTNMEERKRAYGLPADIPAYKLLYEIIKNETISNGWFSIKIMWETLKCNILYLRLLEGNKDKTDRELVFSLFPNPVFVLMTRKDKLKQAISYVKAVKTNIWEYREQAKEYDANLLQFDFLAIEKARKELIADEKTWMKFFAENELQPLVISYEELLKERSTTLNKIFNFAGFEYTHPLNTPKNAMLRMSDNINSEWREKYLQLKAYINNPEIISTHTPCKAIIKTKSRSSPLMPGERFLLNIQVENADNVHWNTTGSIDGCEWTILRAKWISNDGKQPHWDMSRGYLPARLDPGKIADVKMTVTAPENVGVYTLEIHIVLEEDYQPNILIDASDAITITTDYDKKAKLASNYFGPSVISQLANWKWLPWLGYYYDPLFPWICHDKIGWMLCEGTGVKSDEYYFSQNELGWIKTSSKEFPRVWSNNLNAFLEYERGTTNPCRFKNVDTGEIIEVEPAFKDK